MVNYNIQLRYRNNHF